MALTPHEKAHYWKEREQRFNAFAAKLGRPPTTSDHMAFAKSEKKHRAVLEKKPLQTGPRGGLFYLDDQGRRVYRR